MTINEAINNLRSYYDKDIKTTEDDYTYIESLKFIIDTQSDPRAMLELGGHYYAKKRFDLAEKYYLMASDYDMNDAFLCLGYINYYGRCRERNFEKAFQYYTMAMQGGSLEAEYKIADMYKNGYGVKQDYNKYVELIQDAYNKLIDINCKEKHLLPNIYTRLANIKKEKGDNEEAIELFEEAKDYLKYIIAKNQFFGYFTVMQLLERDYRSLKPIDYNNFDIYDLYEMCNDECEIQFTYKNAKYKIECKKDEEGIYFVFDNKNYRELSELFTKANIAGELLISLAFLMKNFKYKNCRRK